MGKPWWRRANVFVGVFFWCAVAAGLAWHFSSPTLDDERILAAYFSVDSVRQEKGTLRITSSRGRDVFRIATTDSVIRDVLEGSDNQGKSVSWRLHLGGASIDPELGRAQYWVESFELEGKKYGPWPERARWSWRALPESQAALLRGLGLEMSREFSEAIKQLDIALAAKDLDSPARALALEKRADALEKTAYADNEAINGEDDALLMRAIEDYRQAQKLDPDRYNLVMDEGNATAALGAYDEALALFDTVEKRWPDQYFYVAMRRGAIRRQLGDPEGALRVLDEMARRHDRHRGMMFHYHRGWTLNDLGRYEDAIKDLSTGLESQPDYPWAFSARACAKGQLGRLADAVADQKRAVELFDQMVRATPDGDRGDGQEKLAGNLRALEQALQEAPTRATAAGCREYGDNPRAAKRERSRLFRKT